VVGQKAERRTGVVSEGPGEVAGDDLDLLVQAEVGLEPVLCGLIEGDDQYAQPEPGKLAETRRHAAASAETRRGTERAIPAAVKAAS